MSTTINSTVTARHSKNISLYSMAGTEEPVISIAASEKPPGYPAEILGYVEPWIASPGETVAVKVSPSFYIRTSSRKGRTRPVGKANECGFPPHPQS